MDVATACLHLLAKFRDHDDAHTDSSKDESFLRLAKGVLNLLQRGSPNTLPIEFLLTCIQLFGGCIYSKELLSSSSSQVFSQIKKILFEVTDCESGSTTCHPQFHESYLSAEIISASRRVIHEVIGVESTDSNAVAGRTALREAFQREKAVPMCGLGGCCVSDSSELKLCSRCGVVAYCTGG